MDHNMVYLLIAGSYAPYCLAGIMSYSVPWAWSIYGACLALGVLGVVLNSVSLKKFKIFCMIDYIAMGWLIVFSFYPLIMAIGWYPAALLLFLGGISYTIGAVLYNIGGRYNQWFHVVFHCLCLVGAALMFISIYFFVIP